MLRIRLLMIGSVLLLGCSEAPVPVAVVPITEARFVASQACETCHATQYADWQSSHHDLAMQTADATTVLGDFGGATFDYYGTATQFQRVDGTFIVQTENAGGDREDFRVTHTFGVFPLQQYLVEYPQGRLQALPFAWDTRDADVGGQRWFHLYPDEYIGPGDELHWTGRALNWNYMCAECHSTNVELNYDQAADSFATTWSEIDVGCEACHGPASEHVRKAASGLLGSDFDLPVSLDDSEGAVWQMNLATGIAERSRLAMRPPQQAESCGRCHARRGVITADYEYGKPLAHTHRPALLEEPLYYADGQIRDEVYVYGSFLQSRMYAAGV
ncbi:MAG: cytochrome c family protein, partial [Gammaproteobacteria bacterium]|nr:cytochrome c family protein [Gammaproteobacteria bacterium]